MQNLKVLGFETWTLSYKISLSRLTIFFMVLYLKLELSCIMDHFDATVVFLQQNRTILVLLDIKGLKETGKANEYWQ